MGRLFQNDSFILNIAMTDSTCMVTRHWKRKVNCTRKNPNLSYIKTKCLDDASDFQSHRIPGIPALSNTNPGECFYWDFCSSFRFSR